MIEIGPIVVEYLIPVVSVEPIVQQREI